MSQRVQIGRIKYLVNALNEASEAYYSGGTELMSNYEWDAMFDELTKLEAETGYILPNSPTQTVGNEGERDNYGKKEEHEFPALSLAKTKKIEDLQSWAKNRDIWLSWKLDGLTLVLTYDNGHLTKILTRGNGIFGSNITYLKGAISGFPCDIPYTGHMVVRGEATISYTDFYAINDILDVDERFANPRNLASGTLSPASSAMEAEHIRKVKDRKVHFTAFTLVHCDIPMNSWGERMKYLDSLGFDTVDAERLKACDIPDAVRIWSEMVDEGEIDIPVDGLVICYDDCEYASKGSVTGHHATRAGLAYKWEDTAAISTLDHIEWSCTASMIVPVAVFDPVILEGTKVSRASLYNLSELERLGIGANRRTEIKVIKANKIIPKIVEVTMAYGPYYIPSKCPVCGAPTAIRTSSSGARVLECTSDICPAKSLQKLSRFVSKDGMDIEGLSVETLRELVNAGFVHDFTDIFSLSDHADYICKMEGFGKRSCEKLLRAIENAKVISPINFIVALSIPMIGTDAAKKIINTIGWDEFVERARSGKKFCDIFGIGIEKSNSITEWFANPRNRVIFYKLCEIIQFKEENFPKEEDGIFDGKTFVITGELRVFKNREELKSYIQGLGGKVTGSVSNRTDYLVNDDISSTSSKNVAAMTLGIPIITEEELLELTKKEGA